MSQRILVVDDEPAIADAVADRLRSDGYEVAVVHDGLAAVAAIAERRRRTSWCST